MTNGEWLVQNNVPLRSVVYDAKLHGFVINGILIPADPSDGLKPYVEWLDEKHTCLTFEESSLIMSVMRMLGPLAVKENHPEIQVTGKVMYQIYPSSTLLIRAGDARDIIFSMCLFATDYHFNGLNEDVWYSPESLGVELESVSDKIK